MMKTVTIALLATAMSVGFAQAKGHMAKAKALSNGAADKSNMRLRSGKSGMPERNVVPRLHKRVHAIARTVKAQGRKLPISACARHARPNPTTAHVAENQ